MTNVSLDNELLNFDNRSSVIRRVFGNSILLGDYPVIPMEIPEGFDDFSFKPDNKSHLYKMASSFRNELIENGFEHKLCAGVHEALKNAYQHGNNRDGSRMIILKKRIGPEGAEFFIGDEGGIMHKDFFPYVMRFRENYEPVGFYGFSDKEKLPENGGVGLFSMHLLFDEVNFFKNANNGLLVYLNKSHIPKEI